MMMLGEQHGADPRLIALMQQLRIVLVTLTAIGVAGVAGAAVFPTGAVSAEAVAAAG